MTNISPLGRYRALDSNGDPLAGGKLYTYEAGTSTPKTTFTDSTGNTANTNPIILDSEGYADVWLDAGGYKFRLDDANDVEQWSVDNISGGVTGAFAGTVVSKSASFNLTELEQNNVIVCTASLTVSLLSAATAGDGFAAIIINRSVGDVTVDPSASETINSAATLTIAAGQSATIHCDGAQWFASGLNDVTAAGDNTFSGNNTFSGDNTFSGENTFSGAVTASSTVNLSSATVTWPSFTNLTVLGNTSGAPASATEVTIYDEDDMVSDSATGVATQQSIKAYVDNSVSVPSERPTAWVNFNGTGTVAIRDSFNVSSITDNGVGQYTVNFTTALADANYLVSGTASGISGSSAASGVLCLGLVTTNGTPDLKTTSACEVATVNNNSDIYLDGTEIFVIIHGGN